MKRILAALVMVAAMAVASLPAHAEERTVVFDLGVPCEACDDILTDTLYDLDGVLDVVPDYDNDWFIVHYDDQKCDVKVMQEAVARIGFRATVVTN